MNGSYSSQQHTIQPKTNKKITICAFAQCLLLVVSESINLRKLISSRHRQQLPQPQHDRETEDSVVEH
jgi:hypothetical protein